MNSLLTKLGEILLTQTTFLCLFISLINHSILSKEPLKIYALHTRRNCQTEVA